MVSTVTPLTREELAKFLPSERAVRAFENLFTYTAPSTADIIGHIQDTEIQIVNITADYTVVNGTFMIFVDASIAPVTITMSDAQLAFSSYYNAPFTVGICKTDTSANAVTIIPDPSASPAQTIVGETSQQLLVDGEIINLVSDTMNWQLVA